MNFDLVLVSHVWSVGPGYASCRILEADQDDPIEEDDHDACLRMPVKANPHRGMKGAKKVLVSEASRVTTQAVKRQQTPWVSVSRHFAKFRSCSTECCWPLT